MLVIEGSDLPDYAYIYHQCYKVKLYVAGPWQCYNCQDRGHNAAGCRGKTKCVICAGPHRLRDCPGKVNKEIVVVPKCANCGEGHTASYGLTVGTQK